MTNSFRRSSAAIGNDLGNALNVVSPRFAGFLGTLSGAAGPISVAAVAITGMGAAVLGAAKAITDFTVSVISSIDQIGDMAEKVNFSVRTISGLRTAIESTGGSVEGFSNALGIFDKNIEKAAQGEERLSRLFKGLNIDATDNEKAFRQVAAILVKLDGSAQQTALAMELFGRSGKDVLGIIKETGGDIDGFISKMGALGIVIGDDVVDAADEFDKKMVLVRAQLDGVKRQIAMELLPAVAAGAENVSKYLAGNQQEIKRTINQVEALIKAFQAVASVVAAINPIVLQVRIMTAVTSAIEKGFGGQAIPISVPGMPFPITIPMPSGGNGSAASASRDESAEFAIPFGRVDQPKEKSLEDRIRALLGRGSGGGGGGGGKSQRDTLESLKSTLIGLNAEWRKWDIALLDSAEASAMAAQKQQLLENVMSSLSSKTKLAISGIRDIDEALEKAVSSLPQKSQAGARALIQESLAQFRLNEERRIAGEVNKEAERLTQSWRLEIDNSRSGADEFTKAIQGLEAVYAKYGQTLDNGTRLELENLAAQQRILRVTRERVVVLNQLRQRVVGGDILKDLGGGSLLFRGDATRDRIATVGETVLREREQMRLQEMSEVAEDLGSIFGDAFDSIRGGWRNLWEDMASIAQSMSRQIVQELFTGLFSRAFNVPFQSQSGGIVGGLINRIFGGGGQSPLNLGGGSSFTPGGTGLTRPRVAGARALGGPVEAGLLYRVNETRQEFFRPNVSGQVIPMGQQSPERSEPFRLAIVDDLRQAREWRANQILRARKQSRKIGKLIPGY